MEMIKEIIADMRDLATHRDWHNHTNQSNRERLLNFADRIEQSVTKCKDCIHRAMVLIAGIEMENPEDPPRLWTALEDAWDALCDALGTDGDVNADMAEAKSIGRHFVVKSSGNAAKMREALSDACYAMFNFLKTQNGGYEEMAKALDKAKAALAEPPRNCDIGTAEEQEVRFKNYCWNHSSRDKNMECQCPIDTEGRAGCKLEWAQMPYESEVKK